MKEILAVISWPHIVFLLGLLFIIIFKNPIEGLIKRTTKISKDGLSADDQSEAQIESNTSAEAVQQLLDAVGNSLVINEQVENIRRDLQAKGITIAGDSSVILTKHLAAAQILLEFERIHNSIFGSQIYLLKKLNEAAGQGRPAEFVTNHFDHVKRTFPEQFEQWSLEGYLHFLYSRILIVVQSDRIHITNLGVEYLVWITRNNRSEDRPL